MIVDLHKHSHLNMPPLALSTCKSGFSLIELMIAMVLGLLVIGAVSTVFVSAQQSYRVKANFEEAQEAFRFAAHVMNRIVQSSDSIILPGSTSNELRVELRGGLGVFDCTGTALGDDTTIAYQAFFVGADGTLRCDPDAPAPPDPDSGLPAQPPGEGIALVSRVRSVNFQYADLRDSEAPLKSDYLTPNVAGDNVSWVNVRSVRTTITMDTGLETFFTSTSRGVSIGESITATGQ